MMTLVVVASCSRQLHTHTEATGLAGVLGNKGACGMSMTFLDSTSVAFLSSHLAARPERVKQRNANFRCVLETVGRSGARLCEMEWSGVEWRWQLI